MRYVSLSPSGEKLQSVNLINVVTMSDRSKVLLKIISSDVIYIERLKVLGETAYSLLDYHLNPAERVTPNVCPISPNILWRQFIQGRAGEDYRASIYTVKQNIESADLQIVEEIQGSRFAQRIALLDFIFLCQDRSAKNWIMDNHKRFKAVDNGIFWAYKGRYADKRTVKTGKVDHLNHPMEALISTSGVFTFGLGLFSSLYAGRIINDGLLAWLYEIDWEQYLQELGGLISVLGYPFSIVDDWRFEMLEARGKWLLGARRFPTRIEAFGAEWQQLIDQPKAFKEVWRLEWEINDLDRNRKLR